MAEQNPIRYQDLILPDDSIEKLIGQLEELQQSYTNMANSVKSQAQQVADSLRQVSGATEQGRKKIKESNDEAARLEKAYKKLDEALSANAKEIAKLNVLKREANNYNKNLILRGKEEIKTRQQIKEASYQQLSAQYSLNKAYINTLSATERNTKANREYIKTTKEIYEQMKKLQADTGKMQLNVGNYPLLGGLMNGVGGKALGLGGAAAAGMALAGVIKNNVSLATEYEKSLSVLAAILGTTKEGVEQLSQQAQHLGATTVFTAKEVAELQTELAKLGYTVQEIQNMAPSVLDFAQATGSSLADAASLAGAALRMFEKDTTHTTEFVDKMSAATTKSALNFSFLQNAMSTVAPVANAFGFKIEEVLALLGQLANAGFDASSAATATRNILLNLADANGKLATALGEPVTNLDDLITGLVSLKDKGIDLGEALELTDKRSVAAFNTFLSGTDNVIKLRDEIASADGWARKMADTMADNMEGSLKSLSSAWEGLNLHINQSNGLLRKFVDWLTDAIRWVDKLGQEIDKWFFSGTSGDDVFNRLADKYEKAQEKMANADKKRAEKNKAAGEWEAGVANGGLNGSGGSKGAGGGKSSTKQTKAAQAAAKQALKAQEQHDKQMLDLRRKYEDAMLELVEDEQSKEYAKTSYHYQRQIEDLQAQLTKMGEKDVEGRKLITQQIEVLEKVKYSKLADISEKFAKKEKENQEKIEKAQLQAQQQSLRDRERAIELQYDIDMEEIENIDTSEKEKTRMRLEAEKKRLQALLALYEADGKKLSDKEVELIKKQIANVNKELDENSKSGDIYDILGLNLNDKKKKALDQSFSIAMSYLTSFIDSYAQAAEKKRQLADAAVESAQNVLEKEIEARNNGYANEVDTARKELENAKKNQQKAIEQQKKAQMAQEAIQTAQQASSLITATAEIWSAFASGGPWGIAAAIAATALMFGSFAAAKIKAMSVAGMSTEEYGEGTVELLEGGSHQSGNDIDLGRKSNGTRRRAEGGEFFAVINKRNSRKYRGIIPDVMHSLNNGTFAEKYMNAYDGGGNIFVNEQNGNDLTRLQDDVRLIREQGEQQRYVDGNGNTIIRYKNLRRTIRR